MQNFLRAVAGRAGACILPAVLRAAAVVTALVCGAPAFSPGVVPWAPERAAMRA